MQRALINVRATVKVITNNSNRRYLHPWGEGSFMFRLPPRHPPGSAGSNFINICPCIVSF